MATYTDFLNLELPAGSDYYNVGVTNANFQKLAAFLSSLSAEQVAYLNAAMDGVENVKQALDAQQVDLANKVNVGYQWYDLELLNGFQVWSGMSLQYAKIGSMVTVRGIIIHESGVTPLQSEFAVLPEGFRPSGGFYVLLPISGAGVGGGGYVRMHISNGRMLFNYTNNLSALSANADVYCSFLI